MFSLTSIKSIRWWAASTNTAKVTANASVKAGIDIVKAVDTQITTGRGVVAAQGDAVLSAASSTTSDPTPDATAGGP